MVEDSVVALSAECIAFFDHALKDFPNYRLDATIPSIGVLDHLSYNIRGKKGLSELDQRIITWGAAYIAGIAHDCLSILPSQPRVAVRLLQGPNPDIIIEAKEKAKSKQFYLKASVANQLLVTLQEPPVPMPVMADYSRAIKPHENILNPFACGLFSGMPAHGEGTWTQTSIKESAGRLASVGNYVASSCAAYYGRRYPGEKVGANPNLYLEGGMFPPAGFNEPFPYTRLASGVAKHLKGLGSIEHKDIERIALNWIQASDDMMLPLGFILAAAVAKPPYDPRIRYAAECFGLNQPLMRPGIMIAREILGLEVDWVEMLSLGSVQKCRELFEKDVALGLHPFLRMSFDKAQEPDLRSVVNALAWSKADSARAFMDQLPFQISSDLEVWMQAVYLDLCLGNMDQVAKELNLIGSQNFEQHSIARFDFLELLGLFNLTTGNIEAAASAFSHAFDIQMDSPKRLISAGTNLAGCLLHLGKLEDAKVVIDTTTSTKDTSLSSLITKIDIYSASGETDKANNFTAALAKTAPSDRRVFERVLMTIPQSEPKKTKTVSLPSEPSEDSK